MDCSQEAHDNMLMVGFMNGPGNENPGTVSITFLSLLITEGAGAWLFCIHPTGRASRVQEGPCMSTYLAPRDCRTVRVNSTRSGGRASRLEHRELKEITHL